MVMGYMQSSATAQNFIDMRNANQYSFRVGNHVSYTLLQSQANFAAPSNSNFTHQLVGVGTGRPELVFSKNDNSWQARIKSDNLTAAHSQFLADVGGSIAVDNGMGAGVGNYRYLSRAGGVDGELVPSFLFHDTSAQHFRMANAIGIYFHGGTFGAADGSGPSCFVNFSGSDSSAVQLPSQADFAGGGGNGVLFAEDNANFLPAGAIAVKGATNGELVPLAADATSGTVAGFTAGTGASVLVDSLFDGGLGGSAYTIGDIVRILINKGFFAA